ncbi:sigma 54-interacting transcriptional regulator [Geomicrobium sp. JSM 1781026]|uniref:sigma 54-interacting transcriptional regulator n=1 Tax=Geomicrobium sp. JSM 1781026 TaxID=3344580 RepID=UPI0035C151FF
MKESQQATDLELDIQAIFEHTYDVIFVADAKGNTIRVSNASQKIWGYTPEQLIGRNVYDLEGEGVFRPSVVRLVIEKEEKVTSMQVTSTGRRLIIIGVPIFDDHHAMVRIVNIARDITEVSNLQNELSEAKQLMNDYKYELQLARRNQGIEQWIVARSKSMKAVLNLTKRASLSHSPVLISGESGTGKSVLSSYIHEIRTSTKDHIHVFPCYRLSVSELRYVVQKRQEASSSETILLENIDHATAEEQEEILHLLDEIRHQSKHSNHHAPSIISTTKMDLRALVLEGTFNEQLYQRVSIIHISVPPLRDRKEDIPPLIQQFLVQFNEQYADTKRIGPKMIQELMHHSWPGNVEELENAIEKFVVLTEEDVIDTNQLSMVFSMETNEEPVYVKKLTTLKEALESMEKQLLHMAKLEYPSTVQMAQALGIHQSNVSRKRVKYNL